MRVRRFFVYSEHQGWEAGWVRAFPVFPPDEIGWEYESDEIDLVLNDIIHFFVDQKQSISVGNIVRKSETSVQYGERPGLVK